MYLGTPEIIFGTRACALHCQIAVNCSPPGGALQFGHVFKEGRRMCNGFLLGHAYGHDDVATLTKCTGKLS